MEVNKKVRIHRNSKDILFKYVSKLFQEEFFHVLGIKSGPVDELLPSDLPRVRTKDLEVDFLAHTTNGNLLHWNFKPQSRTKILIVL